MSLAIESEGKGSIEGTLGALVSRCSDPSRKLPVSPEETEKFGIIPSVVGPWREQDMVIRLAQEEKLSAPEHEAKQYVNKYIIEQLKHENDIRAERNQKPIVNGPKLRALRFFVEDGKCVMELDPEGTGYAFMKFIGTNEGLEKCYSSYTQTANDPIDRERFAYLFAPNTPTSLVYVITRDGKVIMSKRDPKRVGTFPNARHGTSGGYLEKDANGKVMGFFETARNETLEEAGISKEHIKDLFCLGIAMNKGIIYPEAVFVAITDYNADEIVDPTKPYVSGEKHNGHLKLEPKDGDSNLEARVLILPDGSVNTALLRAIMRAEDIWSVRGKPDSERGFFTSDETAAFLLLKLFQNLAEKSV